jgi:hypothetical protein
MPQWTTVTVKTVHDDRIEVHSQTTTLDEFVLILYKLRGGAYTLVLRMFLHNLYNLNWKNVFVNFATKLWTVMRDYKILKMHCRGEQRGNYQTYTRIFEGRCGRVGDPSLLPRRERSSVWKTV